MIALECIFKCYRKKCKQKQRAALICGFQRPTEVLAEPAMLRAHVPVRPIQLYQKKIWVQPHCKWKPVFLCLGHLYLSPIWIHIEPPLLLARSLPWASFLLAGWQYQAGGHSPGFHKEPAYLAVQVNEDKRGDQNSSVISGCCCCTWVSAWIKISQMHLAASYSYRLQFQNYFGNFAAESEKAALLDSY